MALKVYKVKYWETPRGIGYVAGTKYGDIINMGQGGETYFQRCDDKGKKYENSLLYPEWRLEKAIDDYELTHRPKKKTHFDFDKAPIITKKQTQ